jgi:uncharacterized protein YuzE
MDLIIRYDPEADVLVVRFKEGALAGEELLDNDVILGYDSEGKIVSVEIMDASKEGAYKPIMDMARPRREAKPLLSKLKPDTHF